MKMLRVSLLTMFMLMVTVTGFCSQQDKSNEVKDARSYLEEVYSNTSKVQSMHVDVAIDLKSAIGNITSTSKVDLLNEPTMLGKIDTDIVMQGLGDKSTKMTINQYIDQVDDNIISYTKISDKWQKQTIPYKADQDLADSKAMMSYIKSVKIKDQTAENVALAVNIDMVKVRSNLADGIKGAIANLDTLKDDDKQQFVKVFDEVLASMGNITYTVTVDKQSKQIVNVYADWSKPAQNAAKVILKQIPLPAGEKDVYKEFTKNIGFIIQEDISHYNNVERFTIPEDIVNNAQEIKKEPQDKQATSLPKEIESAF